MGIANNPGPFWCHTQEEIPKQKHWAILVTGQVREEGYGPGDPSTTKYFIEYIAFLDKALWEEEVVQRTQISLNLRPGNHKPFVAIEVNPANVETSVTVRINQ